MGRQKRTEVSGSGSPRGWWHLSCWHLARSWKGVSRKGRGGLEGQFLAGFASVAHFTYIDTAGLPKLSSVKGLRPMW